MRFELVESVAFVFLFFLVESWCHQTKKKGGCYLRHLAALQVACITSQVLRHQPWFEPRSGAAQRGSKGVEQMCRLVRVGLWLQPRWFVDIVSNSRWGCRVVLKSNAMLQRDAAAR
jgi:hypothetical protein